MNKNYLIVLVMILTASPIFAQKEFNNWFFGNHAGISFNTSDGEPVCQTKGATDTPEGTGTISDKDGDLLFYTDGMTVWNKKHSIMLNGTGLRGAESSTQSALVIPKPGSTNLYYIFTVPDSAKAFYGACYSVVDMKGNGGLGEVVEKNVVLHLNTTEKLINITHSNGKDVWILIHEWQSNKFLAFLLTDKGVDRDAPVISQAGSVHEGPSNGDRWNCWGFMKASCQSDRIAVAQYSSRVTELFDFNPVTGVVSNPVTLPIPGEGYVYGLEFSPDGSKLYVTDELRDHSSGELYQVDLNKDLSRPDESTTLIFRDYLGACLLGPNGKIYIANWNDQYLNVINKPDKPGLDCEFVKRGVELYPGVCQNGLPNFTLFRPGYNTVDSCTEVFDFQDFRDPQSLVMNSYASRLDSMIRLTSTKENSTGSAWYKIPVNIKSGFSTKFRFRIDKGSNSGSDDNSLPGADGIAFVIQNAGTSAVGSPGGGIGYDGIPGSLAVEFDTFTNDSLQITDFHDPNGNHASVMSLGKNPNSSDHASGATLAMNENLPVLRPDGTIYSCEIRYTGQTLKVYLGTVQNPTTAVLTLPSLDLRNLLGLQDGMAYVGFTSATGTAYEIHDILSWSFCGLVAVGVEDDRAHEAMPGPFAIYPNPAGGQACLKLETQAGINTNVRIYSLGGILRQSLDISGTGGYIVKELDLKEFDPGVYLVVIRSGNHRYNARMVVNK